MRRTLHLRIAAFGVLLAALPLSAQDGDSLKREFLSRGPEGFVLELVPGSPGAPSETAYFLEDARLLFVAASGEPAAGTWRFLKESGSVTLELPGGTRTIDRNRILGAYCAVERMDSGKRMWALQRLAPHIAMLRATSALPDEAGYGYGPQMAFDGDPLTAWNEGAAGSGVGESLHVRLDRAVRADAVQLMAGYFDAAYFRANARVKRMRMELLDAAGKLLLERTMDLEDRMAAQGLSFEPMDFVQARFIVLAVYAGEKYNDLAVAEIGFLISGKAIPFSLLSGVIPAVSAASRPRKPAPGAPVEKILYVSESGGNPDVWIMDADGRNARNLTRDEARDVQPRWSAALGLAAFASDRGGRWDVHVMGLDGSGARRWSAEGAPRGSYSRVAPAWSPDGTRLALVEVAPALGDAGAGSAAKAVVAVYDSRGKRLAASAPVEVGALLFGWERSTPNGVVLRKVLLDGVRLEWPEENRLRLTLATTVNGEAVATRREFDAQGAALPTAGGADFRRTPDGKRILFASVDGDPTRWSFPAGRNPVQGLYVADAGGGDPQRLARWNGIDGDVVPSLDGGSALFASDRDGDFEIYRVGLDGKELLFLTDNAAADYDPQTVGAR